MRQFVPQSNLGVREKFGRPPEPEPQDYVTCVECEGSFFEELLASRYKDGVFSVPGQRPHKTAPADFTVLRCLRCGCLHEPLITGGNNAFQQAYKVLRDELADDEKVEEQPVEPLVTPSETGAPTEKKKTA